MLHVRFSPVLALRTRCLGLVFLAGHGAVSAALARTWNVSPDHQGDAPTVAAALDSAQPGDVVLLAPGVYTWTTEGTPAPTMLQMRPGITLRGASATTTILDAESQGRILAGVDVGDAVVIEHLAFVNGLAPRERIVPAARHLGRAPDDAHGGAIDLAGASAPLVRHCAFRGNRANSGVSSGGAIACSAGRIEDCEFVGNRAGVEGFTNGQGGAIFCTTARIERCTFRDNHAWGWEAAAGGAIRCGSATISGCQFDANDAACPGGPSGGAISAAGTPLIEGCVFRDNVADAHYFSANGGAVDAAAGTVRDCVFLRNLATCLRGPGRGGALTGTELTVTGCVFAGNTARRTEPLGAGLGGAIFSRFTSTIEHCTLTGNSGATPDGTGGIHCEETARVTAVVLVQTIQGRACSGEIAWTCSDVWGNAVGNALCGTDGGGNFSADPQFCADPLTAGDVSVRSTSPCLRGGPPACALIGAGAEACTTSAIESRTWSSVKRLYR